MDYPATSDDPSLLGLSRAHWPAKTFLIPAGDTTHHPTYTEHWGGYALTPTQRRERLTPETADIVHHPHNARAQVAAGFLAPIHAAGEAVMMPVRALSTPPLTMVRSDALARLDPSAPAQPLPSAEIVVSTPLPPLPKPVRRLDEPRTPMEPIRPATPARPELPPGLVPDPQANQEEDA